MDRFGFIAHPIDTKTFCDFFGFWGTILRQMPEQVVRNIATQLPPYRLCSFDNVRSLTGVIARGDIFTVPLLPIQIASLPEEKVLDVIEKGIRLCEKKGAKIVGLGGFTSVVGNEGEVLSKRVSVPLTSGNTLTASLTLDSIYKACHVMDVTLADTVVAIVGATGDIGSICTKILSKKVKKVNLAARNEKKLQDFALIIKGYGTSDVEVFKYTKDAVRDADIILSVTSAVSTIIDPINLKPGAIVCDVAIPANIAREVVNARDDILVFEGGLARVAHPEDINGEKISDSIPLGSIYGCLAETVALTLESKFEPFSLGRGNITEEKLMEMKSIADKHGIRHSGFFCGHRFFSEKDIENIRKSAKRQKESVYAER